MKPKERFTIGKQPCAEFLRGDADIAALGDGNRRNLHQCPKCEGNRAWCDNCHSDHHDGGWETCKPGAYAERECPRCEGAGEWDEGPLPARSSTQIDPEYKRVICPDCEGHGRVWPDPDAAA